MVKPTLLLSACAMLFSVAVEAQLDTSSLCETWAELFQSKSDLPTMPDESGLHLSISGKVAIQIAKNMFPNRQEKKHGLDARKQYTFRATFPECKPSPAFYEGQVRQGPYSEATYHFPVHTPNTELGFNHELAELYSLLPFVSKGTNVARSKRKITMRGVEIEDGELTQECVVAAGWECTADLSINDRKSRKTIVRKRFSEPTFFPASRNKKPLFSYIWITARD